MRVPPVESRASGAARVSPVRLPGLALHALKDGVFPVRKLLYPGHLLEEVEPVGRGSDGRAGP